MSEEIRGVDLQWKWDVYEAMVCLQLVANGGTWSKWQQHRTDTRGIVTERAGRFILTRIRELETANGKLAAFVERVGNNAPPMSDEMDTALQYAITFAGFGEIARSLIAELAKTKGEAGGSDYTLSRQTNR